MNADGSLKILNSWRLSQEEQEDRMVRDAPLAGGIKRGPTMTSPSL